MGNGRATTLRFVQEGAKVLAVNRVIASAAETAAMAAKEGGECVPSEADVTKEETLAAAVAEGLRRWGRIDILHNNVGVSIAGGDKPLLELTEQAFDRVCAINLRGTIMACKAGGPGHARAALGRDRQHLLGRGARELPTRRL
jgi:NAD(P)-dependent dehydrogenase (short-subunit alcohol dehydrogenase family)